MMLVYLASEIPGQAWSAIRSSSDSAVWILARASSRLVP